MMTYGLSLFIKAANQMCYQVLQGLHLCPEYQGYQDYLHGKIFLAKKLVTILTTAKTFEVAKQGSGEKNSSLKWRLHQRLELSWECGEKGNGFIQLHVERKE